MFQNASSGFDSADSRQSDIEQDNCWLYFPSRRNCVRPIRSFANDFQGWIDPYHKGDKPSPVWCVVDDDNGG
jgi:hypothetical protein